MRKTLTDKGVVALKPRAQRYAYPDPEMRGHYVRVQPSGAKSFVTVARDPAGKQVWTTIAANDVISIADAREQAREIIKRIRAGLPAFEPRGESFGYVAANWLQRHVMANGLRSAREITRLLNVHVLPLWRDREFTSIRRSDVAALLDDVEDGHSARQADAVLTIVRSMMGWFASRHDDYAVPIIRGMRRQNPKAQARARILDDAEIRAIWKQAEASGTFGAILKLCLLTAQRSRKISAIKWADISVDGEWTIPQEPREKDSAGMLVLPAAALDIIRAQDRIGENPYVFSSLRGDNRPFVGFSASKATFDSKLLGVKAWVVHDLRRSARSLLSRAGVPSEHAERVMGHSVGSAVVQTYDRHSYRDEKASALQRLAALIDGIINPRENVLPMAKRRKRR
jgi:integrase